MHRLVAPRGYVDESWPRTFGKGLALGATHFLLFGAAMTGAMRRWESGGSKRTRPTVGGDGPERTRPTVGGDGESK